MVEPGECTLDHPAFEQDCEALAVIRTEDDLQLKAAMIGHPVQQLTAIAAVDPDEAQFLAGATQLGEQEPGAVAVLDRSGGDQHCQQQTHGVHQEMTFRTIDFLARVIAARPRKGGCLDTLAVQATGSRMLVPARTTSHQRPQRVMDPAPTAVVAPLPKVAVHALPLWILLRQHPPLDTPHRHVQNAVDDLPHVQAAGPSTTFRLWNHFLDNVPLAVSQIAGVLLSVHNYNLHPTLADSRYFSNSL